MCPRPFVGPDGLELVSYPRYRPIEKPASVRRADWSDTATVKTAIGQPARVTHGYRLHQQHLRSISATLRGRRRRLAHMPRLTPT